MRILRELRGAIGGFLEGQEHGICVLHGAREHMPFAFHMLQEFEGAGTDVFLPFVERFESAESYVGGVIARIEASGREAREDATWTLPGGCYEADRAPGARLRETLECARSMLPRGRERPRLVVILCPLEVVDEAGYAGLVRALLGEAERTPPWFRRMRVFVHAVSVEAPLPVRALVLRVDLSPEAMATAARADADEPSLSREQRAQARLQAAMIDAGHHRFEAARAGFDEVYAEAVDLKNAVMAALALSGQGDAARLGGDSAGALAWYERALVPAGEAGSPVILLMLARYLAELYAAAGRAAEAEVFFDGAQRLAGAMPEPETQVRSLVGRGVAQQQRGAPGEVWATSFVTAGVVARASEREDLVEELRPRLVECLGQKVDAELRRSLTGLVGGAG